MATMADLVEATRRQMSSYVRARVETLNEALDTTETGVDVVSTTAPAAVFVGDYIGIDYEVMLVTAISGTTLTVLRGQLGTTAATHDSGAVIDLAPRFARGLILLTLADELRSWPRDLFRVETADIDFPADTRTVELPVGYPGEVLRILRAQRITDYVGYDDVRDGKARLIRDFDVFPSGYGIQMQSAYSQDVSVTVTWAMGFNLTGVTTSSTTTATIGLDDSMLDIPPLGAAARLLAAREVERTDTQAQGQTRRAEEVQAGVMVSVAQRFQQMRDRRLSDEAMRLRSRWGVGF